MYFTEVIHCSEIHSPFFFFYIHTIILISSQPCVVFKAALDCIPSSLVAVSISPVGRLFFFFLVSKWGGQEGFCISSVLFSSHTPTPPTRPGVQQGQLKATMSPPPGNWLKPRKARTPRPALGTLGSVVLTLLPSQRTTITINTQTSRESTLWGQ